MRYNKLGHTDLDVSVVCLGTMTWGQQNTEAEGHEQMDYALDQGVNFWDTAELYSVPPSAETYGRTEEIIGTWFEKTGRRSEVILASKVAGRANRLPWMRPHLHDGETRLDRQSILEACDASLKRLKTDYIDVYQLHWPERETTTFGTMNYTHVPEMDGIALEETLRALEEALLAFPGCAMVISHDRWFLDRIATHILACEGDSQWTFYNGNYQEHEADKKRRLGEEGAKIGPHLRRLRVELKDPVMVVGHEEGTDLAAFFLAAPDHRLAEIVVAVRLVAKPPP